MQHLDIAIEDPRWETVGLAPLAERAIAAALSQLNLPADIAEISLLACDDTRITTLNAEYREKPSPTNVLSWPSEDLAAGTPGALPCAPEIGPDGLISMGDIAISYDTCAAEAAQTGKEMAAHVTHLIVHGTLHLLGYDHETEADARRMEALEVKILGKLGLDNPYRTA